MSERVDMLAGMVHFVDHLASVWHALPAARRGTFAVQPGNDREVLERAASHGIDAVVGLPRGGPAVLVAASGDLNAAYRLGRPTAIMEHGTGQSYAGASAREAGRNPSYAGGMARPAGLFLHPNEHAAARDREAHPRARVEVVGSPFLDDMPARGPGPGPVIATTFHFDGTVAPEARPAFAWYRTAVLELSRRYQVLGHGHPRVIDRLAPWYEQHGIEVVRDFRDVLRRADLLVFDNTSAGYAFAASGRPVVVLDSPDYRRDVHHGLRFWEAADVGVRIADSSDLVAAVDLALTDPPHISAAREAALSIVYAHRSGAAARAAAVLIDWLGQRSEMAA